jgi:hypothetical protein
MDEQSQSAERTVTESTTLIEQIHQLVNDIDELIKQKLDFQAFIVPLLPQVFPFSSLPHSLPACGPQTGNEAINSKLTNTLF